MSDVWETCKVLVWIQLLKMPFDSLFGEPLLNCDIYAKFGRKKLKKSEVTFSINSETLCVEKAFFGKRVWEMTRIENEFRLAFVKLAGYIWLWWKEEGKRMKKLRRGKSHNVWQSKKFLRIIWWIKWAKKPRICWKSREHLFSFSCRKRKKVMNQGKRILVFRTRWQTDNEMPH